ncbi:uncharacterized protein BKCO1_27000111 [Diplodia corticola]|uniref:Uncharacterized protein n=1 Tax=Diplodia corticola TaxID=236234 RepID=A0A1J9R0L7_9PEZI|nr:uncharacterized protein BKCO1_27000111 [Diplodia corticola]OJD33794.1 hypothetical protein BKCO1_27000111 [Diplodia corticola]
MKTFTYVSLFFAGMGLASAVAAPAENLVERAIHEGKCNKENEVCNYKVNGDSRQCNCGAPTGGLCTKTGNVCHWNTNANPDRCNCT